MGQDPPSEATDRTEPVADGKGTGDRRSDHHRWLLELASLPTAAGRENRVIEWIRRWVGERPGLALRADPCGNLVISAAGRCEPEPDTTKPIWITAHLDHPAFVVERVLSPDAVEVSFRGGVMDDYFVGARIRLHAGLAGARAIEGVIAEPLEGPGPFKRYLAELDTDAHMGGGSAEPSPGDVAVWSLPSAEVIEGEVHAPACDDLAGVAAALAALDELERIARSSGRTLSVSVLLTRAEEVGFIGAIGACRHGTMPLSSRVIALENSRAMPEAPIGAGPIVRVGDRLSVFSPSLTASISRCAERIAGGPPPTASQKLSEASRWKWQRKLMPGGACEASVFCAFGYEATCLCLPLGNYHNMGDLDAVQAGTNTTAPTITPERIALHDFDGLVDLLIASGTELDAPGSLRDRLDGLWEQRRGVLDDADRSQPG